MEYPRAHPAHACFSSCSLAHILPAWGTTEKPLLVSALALVVSPEYSHIQSAQEPLDCIYQVQPSHHQMSQDTHLTPTSASDVPLRWPVSKELQDSLAPACISSSHSIRVMPAQGASGPTNQPMPATAPASQYHQAHTVYSRYVTTQGHSFKSRRISCSA